jgi:hypothetical protein
MTFTGPNIVQRLVNLLQTPLRPKVHVIHPDTAIGFLLDVLKSRKASRVVSDRPATGNRRVGRLVTNFIWWRTSRVGGQHRSWTRWERPKRAEHPFRRVGHPNAGTPTRVSAHSNSRRSMQPTARRTSSSSQRSARPMRLSGTQKGSFSHGVRRATSISDKPSILTESQTPRVLRANRGRSSPSRPGY